MTPLSFPVFDADNHLYETTDSFTRYLPSEYGSAIRYVTVNERVKLAIGGRISDFIPNPTFEKVARPGAWMEYYRGNNASGQSLRELAGEPIEPPTAFREPGPRVTLLDELGLKAALIFPTLASVLEARLMDDPDLTAAVVHAYNRWMHEEWTFNYQGRLFPVPIVNLACLDKALAEFEWICERGARIILVRPAPVAGYRGPRSPFLEEFDDFWREVEKAGIPVALHSSDSGYSSYISDWEGSRSEYLPFKPSPFRQLSLGRRPIMDAMFSAVGHGMLSRFPDVKLAAIENGSDWVFDVLRDLDHWFHKIPQSFVEDPVEVFKRQVWICPFWEDQLIPLIDEIGVNHVIFGSDFPHPEGLDDPTSWFDFCMTQGISGDDVASLMGGNLARLLKVSLDEDAVGQASGTVGST